MKTNNAILTRIKELMRQQGIVSVTELSKRMNVPQPTLQKLLSGHTQNLRQKLLEKISNHFSVTTSFLLTGKDDKTSDHSTITVPLKIIKSSQLLSLNEEFILRESYHNIDHAILVSDDSFFPAFQSGSYLLMQTISDIDNLHGAYLLLNQNEKMHIYMIKLTNNTYEGFSVMFPTAPPQLFQYDNLIRDAYLIVEIRRYLKKE